MSDLAPEPAAESAPPSESAAASVPPSGPGVELRPLACPRCGASFAFTIKGDAARCAGCGTSVPLPERALALRELQRRTDKEVAHLDHVANSRGWYGLWASTFVYGSITLFCYLFAPLAPFIAIRWAASHALGWRYSLVDQWSYPLFYTMSALGYVFILFPWLWAAAKRASDPRQDMKLVIDPWLVMVKDLGSDYRACPRCGKSLKIAPGVPSMKCPCGAQHLVERSEEAAQRWTAMCTRLHALHEDLNRTARAKFRRKLSINWTVFVAICLGFIASVYAPFYLDAGPPRDWNAAISATERPIRLAGAFGDYQLDREEVFTVHKCVRVIQGNDRLCGLRLDVPLRRGETFRFASAALPDGAVIEGASLYYTDGDVPGRFVKPRGEAPTLEFVAPFSGWFELAVAMPLAGDKLLLPTRLSVLPPTGDGSRG